jgi:hypothetical protein
MVLKVIMVNKKRGILSKIPLLFLLLGGDTERYSNCTDGYNIFPSPNIRKISDNMAS